MHATHHALTPRTRRTRAQTVRAMISDINEGDGTLDVIFEGPGGAAGPEGVVPAAGATRLLKVGWVEPV